jgi:hypothetical protein
VKAEQTSGHERGDNHWNGITPRKSSRLVRRCSRQAIIPLVLTNADFDEG